MLTYRALRYQRFRIGLWRSYYGRRSSNNRDPLTLTRVYAEAHEPPGYYLPQPPGVYLYLLSNIRNTRSQQRKIAPAYFRLYRLKTIERTAREGRWYLLDRRTREARPTTDPLGMDVLHKNTRRPSSGRRRGGMFRLTLRLNLLGPCDVVGGHYANRSGLIVSDPGRCFGVAASPATDRLINASAVAVTPRFSGGVVYRLRSPRGTKREEIDYPMLARSRGSVAGVPRS